MMLISTTKTRRPLGCGKSRAVESEENQKQVFLPSHRPWKSRKTRGIPTFPTAPTAAGISQTRSGILIVVDRKECLTPDTALPGNRFEALKGDRKGQYRIRINDGGGFASNGLRDTPGPSQVEIDYHKEKYHATQMLFILANIWPKN